MRKPKQPIPPAHQAYVDHFLACVTPNCEECARLAQLAKEERERGRK